MVKWTSNFTKAQVGGIPKKDNAISQAITLLEVTTVLQDNTSTKCLAGFGRQSQGKDTRHVGIQYFYITEKIKDGHMQVLY